MSLRAPRARARLRSWITAVFRKSAHSIELSVTALRRPLSPLSSEASTGNITGTQFEMSDRATAAVDTGCALKRACDNRAQTNASGMPINHARDSNQPLWRTRSARDGRHPGAFGEARTGAGTDGVRRRELYRHLSPLRSLRGVPYVSNAAALRAWCRRIRNGGATRRRGPRVLGGG